MMLVSLTAGSGEVLTYTISAEALMRALGLAQQVINDNLQSSRLRFEAPPITAGPLRVLAKSTT
jgi:hypothetical protein